MTEKPSDKSDNSFLIFVLIALLGWCVSDEVGKLKARIDVLESKAGIVTTDGKTEK